MSKIRTIEVSEFISVEYQLAPTTLLLFRKRFIVAQLVKDCQPLCAIIISFKKSAGDCFYALGESVHKLMTLRGSFKSGLKI